MNRFLYIFISVISILIAFQSDVGAKERVAKITTQEVEVPNEYRPSRYKIIGNTFIYNDWSEDFLKAYNANSFEVYTSQEIDSKISTVNSSVASLGKDMVAMDKAMRKQITTAVSSILTTTVPESVKKKLTDDIMLVMRKELDRQVKAQTADLATKVASKLAQDPIFLKTLAAQLAAKKQ